MVFDVVLRLTEFVVLSKIIVKTCAEAERRYKR